MSLKLGHDSLTFETLQTEPRRFARGMVSSGLWLAVVLAADQACTMAGHVLPSGVVSSGSVLRRARRFS